VEIITESDIFEALLGMTGANTRGSKMVLECGNVKNALLLIVRLSERHELSILNVFSYRDPTTTDKVILVFHFTQRPNTDFVQEICRQGIRLLSLV
jgi:hypothetical protein